MSKSFFCVYLFVFYNILLYYLYTATIVKSCPFPPSKLPGDVDAVIVRHDLNDLSDPANINLNNRNDGNV